MSFGIILDTNGFSSGMQPHIMPILTSTIDHIRPYDTLNTKLGIAPSPGVTCGELALAVVTPRACWR